MLYMILVKTLGLILLGGQVAWCDTPPVTVTVTVTVTSSTVVSSCETLTGGSSTSLMDQVATTSVISPATTVSTTAEETPTIVTTLSTMTPTTATSYSAVNTTSLSLATATTYTEAANTTVPVTSAIISSAATSETSISSTTPSAVVTVSTTVAAPSCATSTMAPLFNPTSIPTCEDIERQDINNWWFDVALCALVKCNPGWITNQAASENEGQSVSWAMFLIYDGSLTAHQEVVCYSDAVLEGDSDQSGEYWWPSGYRKAVETLGFSGQTTSGSMAGGTLATGLEMLTGFNASILNTHSLDMDDLLTSYISRVDATPMTLSTWANATNLIQSAYYTVMHLDSTTTPGVNSVTLHDVFAGEVTFDFTEIYDDIFQLGYLTDGESYAAAPFALPSST